MRRDQVVVEVQGTTRVDAALQVGEMGQVVEVKSDAPLLQTETSSLGHMVQSRAVLEMPLNGRNVMNLVALAPGHCLRDESLALCQRARAHFAAQFEADQFATISS